MWNFTCTPLDLVAAALIDPAAPPCSALVSQFLISPEKPLYVSLISLRDIQIKLISQSETGQCFNLRPKFFKTPREYVQQFNVSLYLTFIYSTYKKETCLITNSKLQSIIRYIYIYKKKKSYGLEKKRVGLSIAGVIAYCAFPCKTCIQRTCL